MANSRHDPSSKDVKTDAKITPIPLAVPATDDTYKTFCNDIAPVECIRYPDTQQVKHYNESKFQPIVKQFFLNPPHVDATPLSQTSDLFFRNFIVGEAHSHMASKKFLIDNMKTLKKGGHEFLFMEHLFYDQQKDMDDYLQTGIFSQRLKDRLDFLDNNWSMPYLMGPDNEEAWDRWQKYNFTALVKAARAADMRIVGIDVENVFYTQQIGIDNKQENNTRTSYMNYTAYKIIERELSLAKNKPAKWCSLMGNLHVKTHKGTPGVADMTGANSVYVFDKGQNYRKPLDHYQLSHEEKTNLSETKLNTKYEIKIEDETISFPADVLITQHPDLPTPSLKQNLFDAKSVKSPTLFAAAPTEQTENPAAGPSSTTNKPGN